MSRERTGDRGAATTELVLLTPVLILVLLFVVALGRVASARQDVDAAARDAARAAANARSATAARTDGAAAAQATLSDGGITCRSLSIDIATDNFRAGGVVTANVSCTVDLDDLTGLRMPTSHTISASFTAPL
ncbi:MAG: TadE/TadG family type IV pilus assembly protein, partial [Acidimicrobiia bacterium]